MKTTPSRIASLVLRIVGTAVIIRGLYRETGAYTAAFAVLVTVAIELAAWQLRMVIVALGAIRDIMQMQFPKRREP